MPNPNPALDEVDHRLFALLQHAPVGPFDWDYVVIVACSGMAHHTEVANRLFNEAPNVRRYTTLFVLDPVRTSGALPTRAPNT